MKALKFSAFFQMMGLSVAGLLPLFWKRTLGFDDSLVGYLNAIALGMALAAPLVFGWLGSHWKIHRILIFCYGMTTLFAPLMIFGRVFWLQAVLFAVVASMRGGYMTLVPATVLHFIKDKAGEEYGRYRRFGSIGFLSGVIGVGYLVDWLDARVVVWVIGFAALIAMLPFLFNIRVPQAQEKPGSYFSVFRHPGMTPFYIGIFFVSMWWAPAFVFLPIRLEEMGASASFVGWTLSIYGVLALLTLKKIGSLVDGFSKIGVFKRASSYELFFLIPPVAAALRIFLLGVPQTEIHWFLWIQILHIPTWVLTEILQMKYLKTKLPSQAFAKAGAMLTVCTGLGMSASSALIGFLRESMSLDQALRMAAFTPLLALPFFYKVYLDRNSSQNTH